MFSALQQGGKRLYDLARQGQVVERAARPVRVHDLELLRTRRDWQRAAVSKRHPCHLQHPQISHKDSTATTASALASAARAESPGWSEVLQLSPVICSAARAAGVRDETPPISPHAFPAQLRRRSETEGASVPGEDAAAAAVLGDDSGSGGDEDCIELPCFALDVECGGGTYVRSLISDIAKHPIVGSAAHMVWLERTRQGPFGLEDCLPQSLWTYEQICEHTTSCTRVVEGLSTARGART